MDARLRAMLAVSRAVVAGETLKDTLDDIAAHARAIACSESAAILELTGDNRFRVVGNSGLSQDYIETLSAWPGPLRPGIGPSGVAVAEGRPIMIADFNNDARFSEWAMMPMRGQWRAAGALPLIVNGAILGTLVLYLTDTHAWEDDEVELLAFIAEHVAVAVRTAQLADEQQRQIAALQRVVRSLRGQAHEHANRLHTIGGLLALGESSEALAFVESVGYSSLIDRRSLAAGPQTALSALLAVESRLARLRSITLEVDTGPGLGDTALTDPQAVTIVGNALDNAFEAVAEMPDDRRRVEVKVSGAGTSVEIAVRDWGPGIPEGIPDPFARGASAKPGHSGVGLLLAREAAIAAYGDVLIERLEDGTRVVARVPVVSWPEPGSNSQHRALQGLAAPRGRF